MTGGHHHTHHQRGHHQRGMNPQSGGRTSEIRMAAKKSVSYLARERRERLKDWADDEQVEHEKALVEARHAMQSNATTDAFNHHRFQKGQTRPPNSGRKPGTPNKISVIMRNGVEAAAEAAGFVARDKRGVYRATKEGGVNGYITSLAIHHPGLYIKLWLAVFAAEVNGKNLKEPEANRVFRTAEEMRARMRERGIPIPPHLQLPKSKDTKT